MMLDRRAALALIAVVAGAVGLALVLLFTRSERDLQSEAAGVFESYAAAWEQWDTATMATLVNGDTEQLTEMHKQWAEVLGEAQVAVEVGTVERERAQAGADITVSVDPEWSSPFEWTGRLTATIEDNRWLIAWAPSVLHPELRDHYRLDVVTTEGGRAPILGADGVELSGSGERHVIGIEPRRISDPDRLRDTIARVLPEASGDLEDLLSDRGLVPHWFYPLISLRPDRYEVVWDSLRPIEGVLVRSEAGRLPIDDGFARHIIGRVGEFTAEDLEELGPPYKAGDTGGLYGLERVFEDQLVGGESVSILIREPDDDIHVVLHEYSGDPATPVRTTIDEQLQQSVENGLVGVQNAAVVMVEIESGAIRASASRPLDGYNRAWGGRYRMGAIVNLLDADATAVRSDDWIQQLPLQASPSALVDDRSFSEASVLHVASAAAAAQSGTWRPPWLLEEHGPTDGVPLTGGDRRQVLVDATPDALPDGADVDGLIGLSTSAPAASGADHGWFVGVRDGIAIAVLVESAGDGRSSAAPIAVRIFNELDAIRG